MKKEFTKQLLSIQELSNLSEIEKGTIRVWEKRYHILEPQRTDTNIRLYTLDDLKFLLNIKLLIDKGYKISKIAAMSNREIEELIADNYENDFSVSTHVKRMLLDVLVFDKESFEAHYNQISETNDFKTIYMDYIVPLLYYVGVLWQTNNLDISHEHFLVEIIKQKLYSEINKESINFKSKETFILFLPENEIHDVGLLFFHYLLIVNQINCIMLGATIPLDALDKFINSEEPIYFVSHLSTNFRIEEITKFLQELILQIDNKRDKKLWITGSAIHDLKNNIKSSNCRFIESIDDLKNQLKKIGYAKEKMESR